MMFSVVIRFEVMLKLILIMYLLWWLWCCMMNVVGKVLMVRFRLNRFMGKVI